jgi:uncharacterized protein with PQ loop repeat
MIHALGIFGMVLVQCATIPQIVEIVLTGSVKNLSLSMYTCLMVGLAAFILHSAATQNWLYLISNSVGFINATIIWVLIIVKG